MKLPHLIAINTLGIEINPNNFYTENEDEYVITVPDKATSIIPKSKVELGIARTTALLKRYPIESFVKYRFTIVLSDYLDDTDDERMLLVRNLIKTMVPYGFHFDIFLAHDMEHTRFFDLGLDGVTYYIHAIDKGIEDVFVYSPDSATKVVTIDFLRYLEDYTPVVVMTIDYDSCNAVGYYSKAIESDTRFLSYMFNSNLINSSPREINFSNQMTLNQLNYLEETEHHFVGVESNEVSETLKEMLSSPRRIFGLPIPGKMSRTYHGYTEGRNGVLVFPNNEGSICRETAEKLSALGLPVTFVYSEDDTVDLPLTKQICDDEMLTNVAFLGPVPNHFMVGVINSARMVISEDYRIKQTYLDMLDGQTVVTALGNPYPPTNNYIVLNIPTGPEADFDESCERIESSYGDIATVLASKEETDEETALAAWFYWLFGDDGLKMLA